MGVGALVVFLLLAAQVEDWSRDLWIHEAATSSDGPDLALRPIVSGRSMDDLAEHVRLAAAGLPRWELLEDDHRLRLRTLRFVRRSALFGFADDVEVTIRDDGATRVIAASSRSRVGKGDLGQNPRNLRALLGALRERLRD